MPKTTLIKHAHTLVTMDAEGREISDGALYIKGNLIHFVGASSELPPDCQTADTVLDLKGQHILLPGFINTHHHMVQSLTRAVPAAQNAELFSWLKTLYPIWARLTGRAVLVSNQLAMAELMLSGCTTSSDHFYIYPNDCRLDDSIEAAQQIGLRFHATRGSMSVGESKGGLPPDSVVEDEAFILKDSQRLIERYHDASHAAMLRVAVAPCSPFSVSEDLMRESAKLARHYQVGMHTHLAESDRDVAYSIERFGKTPAQYAESLGWVGAGVWHAHCVCLDQQGMSLFARTHTGVAHCPSSNMRLASGIAPVKQMLATGVNVGLGVDGSASNDSGDLLAEIRQAMLLARVKAVQGNDGDPAALTARQVLALATTGGAAVLNRSDIGSLEVGKAADCASFNLADHRYAGALHDPVAALVFCAPTPAQHVFINGVQRVSHGQLLSFELPVLVAEHNAIARNLVNGDAQRSPFSVVGVDLNISSDDWLSAIHEGRRAF
jgi:8-oxoguanine deaminase